MLKWKPLCGLLVLILGLGTVLCPRPVEARADGPAKDDTAKFQRPTNDSRLARRMLDRLAQTDFVGTIDFAHHATESTSPARSEIKQTGRLFIGPNRRVRLDLTLKDGDQPVICCVADGQAWMLMPRSSLVHATRFPFPGDQADDGMLGQLRMQTHQTLVWENMLVHNLFADSSQRRLESARLADGRLSFKLGPAGSDDQIGAMKVEATFMKKFDGYYPTRITFENSGNIMTLDDYVRTKHDRVMARQVTQKLRRSGRRVSWKISDIKPRKSTDREFIEQSFEPPTARSETRPSLIGLCFYDDAGKEVYEVW